MKTYHSIDHFFDTKTLLGCRIYAFKKYDGSNFRTEWNYKQRNTVCKGFTKFGTKTQLIDENNEQFGEAVKIFKDKYSEPLCESLANRSKRSEFNGIDKITSYFEFFGEKSFAGFHYPDDPKDLVLLDVFLEKKGYLPPKYFMEIFSKQWYLRIAELIYEGNLNMEFANSIKDNDWNSPTAIYPSIKEGVVCKDISISKGQKLLMSKIKTAWWINELKNKHPKNFNELL